MKKLLVMAFVLSAVVFVEMAMPVCVVAQDAGTGEGWAVVRDEEDPFDGTRFLAFALTSEESALALRCMNGDVDVLVMWEDYVDNEERRRVLIKAGDAEDATLEPPATGLVVSQSWYTDGSTSFADKPEEMLNVLSALAGAENRMLHLRTTTYDGDRVTASFDIPRDTPAYVVKVRAACAG